MSPAAQQALLVRIFAPGFEQQTLCGGFSGSAVVRVSPVDGDPVVVKLDSAGIYDMSEVEQASDAALAGGVNVNSKVSAATAPAVDRFQKRWVAAVLDDDKSEQDELIDDSSIFELGGTLSLSIPEVTFRGYKATPSLNLTHMRFFNAKLAEILDFETQVVAASMGLQVTDTLSITPGVDYNRMISPGGTDHKFHGTGASLMAMKMIPHGDKGMFMLMGGGKWNWTTGDALLDPVTGVPIVEVDPVTREIGLPLRTEDEQDRWDANLNLNYMYNLPSGIIFSPSAGIAMSNYIVNRNKGRRDITYTLGANLSLPLLEWLNTQAFGTYSFKKTNAKGKELLTQEYDNFDFGMSLGYSKAF